MSAPERIWAKPLPVKVVCAGEYHEDGESGGTEYIRADVAAAQFALGFRAGIEAAAGVCSSVIKDYDVMKPDGKTYEPLRVQKAAKGMVRLAREDIRAIPILGDPLAAALALPEVRAMRDALDAMLGRHVLYCGGDELPFAGHTDKALFDKAHAALQDIKESSDG